MKFSHTGLFIPKGVNPNKVSDTRKYSFKSNTSLRSGNRASHLRDRAIDDGFINRHSMYKYWDLVLGESKIIDSKFDSLTDMETSIENVQGVKNVKVQKDKTKKSLILVPDSNEDEADIKKRVKSSIGSNTPIYAGYSHLELVVSYKWLGCSDKFFFDDVIELW